MPGLAGCASVVVIKRKREEELLTMYIAIRSKVGGVHVCTYTCTYSSIPVQVHVYRVLQIHATYMYRYCNTVRTRRASYMAIYTRRVLNTYSITCTRLLHADYGAIWHIAIGSSAINTGTGTE